MNDDHKEKYHKEDEEKKKNYIKKEGETESDIKRMGRSRRERECFPIKMNVDLEIEELR